jgi:hypothetical protein
MNPAHIMEDNLHYAESTSITVNISQVWWAMLVISALRRLRQEDLSAKPAWAA